MAIVKPENLTFDQQKFCVILYGSPGVGKTTLALSAPNPVLVDFDHGACRVRAQHRKPTIVAETYEEVLADLQSPEMSEFDTIIIDTGGSFVTYLQAWAMRNNPQQNKQKNGAISLKGHGAVKLEFARFSSYLKDTLRKNVIYIFHSQEQSDKDGNPIQRLICDGSAKNAVWTPCDFGGYIQMIGDERVACFSPEQEFFAKGCHGINGRIKIPTLGAADKNDFMTRLFERARENIAKDKAEFDAQYSGYAAVMDAVKSICEGVVDPDTANAAVETIKGMEHCLTSRTEASKMLNDKAAALGLKYSKSAGGYIEV